MPIFYPPQFVAPGSTAFHGILTGAGAYISTGMNYQVDSTTPIGSDTILLTPFFPMRDIVADSIAFYNAALVGARAKLILYNADNNGGPDGLLFQSAITDIAAGGQTDIAINQTFAAFTQYWIGIHNELGSLDYRYNSLGGVIVPWNNPDFFAAHQGITRSFLFANNAPDPWVLDLSESVGGGPCFFIRAT